MLRHVSQLLSHGAYFGIVVVLVMMIPKDLITHADTAAGSIFILGFLGTWRYTWALTNFTRAVLYIR